MKKSKKDIQYNTIHPKNNMTNDASINTLCSKLIIRQYGHLT